MPSASMALAPNLHVFTNLKPKGFSNPKGNFLLSLYPIQSEKPKGLGHLAFAWLTHWSRWRGMWTSYRDLLPPQKPYSVSPVLLHHEVSHLCMGSILSTSFFPQLTNI